MSAAAGSATPRAGLRFCIRLGARFARSSALARSASIVLVAGMFVLAMFVTLQTLTLSGAQIVQRDLGRFGASVGYGTIAARPGDDAIVRDLLRAARRAGATGAMVSLSATDVQLATGGVGGGPREVTLQEAAWASRPFPGRYVLLAGRWPRRPGEVVVTDPQDVAAVAGAPLSALGGGARLRVVGTADDRYARTSALLAAPGTWAGLSRRLAERFPLLRAQPVLFWSGSSASHVVAAFAAVVKARGGADAGLSSVADSHLTRDQLAVDREPTWISRTPAGYTVPSLLLPLAAIALVFGLNHRRFRRILHVLTSLGIRLPVGVASLSLAVAGWCLLAAGAGALAGTVLGLAARDLIAHLRGLPAGPVSDLGEPLLRVVGAVGVGATCAGLLLFAGCRAAPAPGPGPAARPDRQGRGRGARHLLAIAAWCATALLALEVDSPAKAMILAGVLTVGVLLLVPELVDLALRLLPERGARTRLGRRQLAADRQRAAAAVTLLAVILGGSLGYLTLLQTLVRTADQQAYPDVLPGQLLVTDRSSQLLPPPRQVLQAVERSGIVRQRPRLELRYLYQPNRAGNVTRGVSLEGTIESIIALDSVRQVEQLLAHPLTARQATVLRREGMLVWTDTASTTGRTAAGSRLAVTSGDTRIGPPIEVPVATVDSDDVGWRVGTSGVLLTSTARRLGLPVTTGATMYTGLSTSQARGLQDAVVRAGLDARTIQLHRPPPPAVPPAALLATAAGLVILALLASLVATRGQARILRGYLGRLVSIGLPISWARHVLLYQQAVIVAVATLAGLLIAIPPVILATLRISGFVLSIPWAQILVLTVSTYAATGLAALHASRRLRPRGDAYEQA